MADIFKVRLINGMFKGAGGVQSDLKFKGRLGSVLVDLLRGRIEKDGGKPM